MGISNYLENKLLEKALKNTDFTITTVYVGLNTGDPGETGANEVVGGSYSRQSVTFGSASGGVIKNTNLITFSGMPSCTVTYLVLWDDPTAGNPLFVGPIIPPSGRTYGAGETATINIDALEVNLD